MNEKFKKCSIIIRTKNEERWVGACLSAVFEQSYKNFEVIIVDNKSTDRTLEKVSQYPVKEIVTISKYLPGDSLNIGINASSGDYIVCLSSHCIPTNDKWLENLVKALEEDEKYAGVYGRQESMTFSSAADKRDLLLVFGLDQKIQIKDSFFHNANSILRRYLWDEVPFDPKITNIEDRIWGQEMINRGFKIRYEPDASVYHYHGIHQNGNTERCENVVRIIENMQLKQNGSGNLDATKLNIVAIVPVRGCDVILNEKSQMFFTIDKALKSKYINKIFVSTESQQTATIAVDLGANAYIRPETLSHEYIGLETVYKDVLKHIERKNSIPDLIVTLEETFPFRDDGLIDAIIDQVLVEGYDSVIAAKRESGSLWREEQNIGFKRIDSGFIPREFKEKSYVGLKGLCCVTHPEFIRNEQLLGNKVGLYEVRSPFSAIEVRDDLSRKIAEQIIKTLD
jgi:rhamnosyltransferase